MRASAFHNEVTGGGGAEIEALIKLFEVANIRFRQNKNITPEESDPRYADFVDRGKVWAVGDDTLRPSKRQKDPVDIARLIEPAIGDSVPPETMRRIES